MLGVSNLRNIVTGDIAIDLGTANTLVWIKGQGIVLNEPSIVSRNVVNGDIIAVGNEAREMVGRTHSGIETIRPLKDGVIADYKMTDAMISGFIRKIKLSRIARPRIVICIPSGVTDVEQRSVMESAEHANASEVYLIEEPMAAAIGAGLPISEPSGNMILDVGGGTTEVAVISLSGIVYSESTRIGGDRVDDTIVQYMKQQYSMLIGERTAEDIKIQLASAYPLAESLTMEVKGRDLVSGIPKTLYINDTEIREALSDVCSSIVQAVRNALESTPPELSSDIVDRGIVLAGGGSLLKGLDLLLRDQTGLPVMYADDPLSAVANGTGKVLDELDLLSTISLD